jgi:hypothetical protein
MGPIFAHPRPNFETAPNFEMAPGVPMGPITPVGSMLDSCLAKPGPFVDGDSSDTKDQELLEHRC